MIRSAVLVPPCLYLCWTLLTVAVWPVLRLCGLGGFVSWTLARAIGIQMFAIAGLHVIRWSHLDPCEGLFWGCAAAALVLSALCWRSLPRLGTLERRAIVKTEAACFVIVAALVVVFGWHYGGRALGERRLDLGTFTSLWWTRRLPAEDFWFAARPLNIYYLGHWSMAMLARACGAVPHLAYLPCLAIVWMQAVAAALFAARVLGARRSGVWAAATLATAVGTGAVLFNWAHLGVSPFAPPALGLLTRVIPHTINENPAVALWFSELHAHVAALPLLMAWAGCVWIALSRHSVRMAALSGLLAGALFMTDAWLAPPAALAAAALAAAACLSAPPGARCKALGSAFLAGCVIATSALATAAPFLVDYMSYPLRVLPVRHSQTTLLHLLVLFGPCALVCLVLLAGAVVSSGLPRGRTIRATCLIAAAAITIALCELVYLDNDFAPPAERQNTVFRFHFAAWVLFALAAACLWPSRRRAGFAAGMAAWVTIAAFATAGSLPGLAAVVRGGGAWTCDARTALDPNHDGIIEVAQWLADHTKPGTAIVESAGPPYRGFASVSAMSGRTALLGEMDKVLSHNVPALEVRQRLDAVIQIYHATPGSEAILQYYGVSYLVLGPHEKKAFPGCAPDVLMRKYRIAYRARNTFLLDTRTTAPQ